MVRNKYSHNTQKQQHQQGLADDYKLPRPLVEKIQARRGKNLNPFSARQCMERHSKATRARLKKQQASELFLNKRRLTTNDVISRFLLRRLGQDLPASCMYSNKPVSLLVMPYLSIHQSVMWPVACLNTDLGTSSGLNTGIAYLWSAHVGPVGYLSPLSLSLYSATEIVYFADNLSIRIQKSCFPFNNITSIQLDYSTLPFSLQIWLPRKPWIWDHHILQSTNSSHVWLRNAVLMQLSQGRILQSV